MPSHKFLITGAGSGIGRAVALSLAAKGHRVFAGVRREKDAEKLQQDHENIHPLILDVTHEEHRSKAVNQLSEACGESGLHGLINNAGMVVAGPLEAMTPEQLKRQFEVNLFAAAEMTRLCLPLVRKSKGRIVNIGSISGRVAPPFVGPYAMSKAALGSYSDALRRELSLQGMHVILIEPGAVRTPIWGKSADHALDHMERWPEEAKAVYGKPTAMLKAAQKLEKSGMPVRVVVKVIEKALFSKRPKGRYLVGREARLQNLLNTLLPGAWMDRLILKFLGLKKNG